MKPLIEMIQDQIDEHTSEIERLTLRRDGHEKNVRLDECKIATHEKDVALLRDYLKMLESMVAST